jgi:Membrane-associated phospholipid phosphatase
MSIINAIFIGTSNIFTEIIKYNTLWFYFINNGLQNTFLNVLMPILTDFGSLIAWCLICVVLYVFGGRKAKKVAILALIALFLSNVTVYFLKYIVAEPRPFLVLSHVHQLIPESELYSFPSGHTTSSFAAATVIGLKYKLRIKNTGFRLIYLLLTFAAVIGFSRIYIGVHYPLDVVFGALIGIAFALMVLKLEKWIFTSKLSEKIGVNKLVSLDIFSMIRKGINRHKNPKY